MARQAGARRSPHAGSLTKEHPWTHLVRVRLSCHHGAHDRCGPTVPIGSGPATKHAAHVGDMVVGELGAGLPTPPRRRTEGLPAPPTTGILNMSQARDQRRVTEPPETDQDDPGRSPYQDGR